MTKLQRHLMVVASLVIILLTAAAFALSYAHLADVAGANGLPSDWRRWAWPGCLDAFILAGEVLMLVGALGGKRDPWSVGLTVAGSVGSIGLNVAGVGTDADPLQYLVAGVPPTAALLAFGALMHQILVRVRDADETHETPGQRQDVPRDVAPETPVETDVAEPVAEPFPALQPVPDVPRLLTVAEVAAEAGVSPSTVRTWVHRGRIAPTSRDGGMKFSPDVLTAA